MSKIVLMYAIIVLIQHDGQRHIVLATKTQLDLLQKSKQWYADGTFKLVRDPFCQLWSIHAFVREGEATKQVPLVFCLMTRRQKSDYEAVLTAILRMLPCHPVVKEMVMDFEKAAWSAVAKVLPNVHVHGCAFHWGQAVWRKTQNLGLRSLYLQDSQTFR